MDSSNNSSSNIFFPSAKYFYLIPDYEIKFLIQYLLQFLTTPQHLKHWTN